MSGQNKFFAVIPTYKRVGKITTLNLFPNATLCVNKEEYEAYKEFYPTCPIIHTPEGMYGLTPKLNYILKYCEENNINRMLKVDDDFKQMRSCLDGYSNVITDSDYISEVIERLFIMCEDSGTTLFTFDPTFDIRRYRLNDPFSLFSSIKIGIYGLIIGDGFRFDERFVLKQDMDMAMRTAWKHKFFIVENRYSFAYSLTMSTIGGCAEYRNQQREQEMINLLTQKYGRTLISVAGAERTKGYTVNLRNPYG
jgi:hypothetical protein